jgi:hypothetical protein
MNITFFTYFLIFGFIILFYKFLAKSYDNYLNHRENRFILHDDEKLSITSIGTETPIYILWNGNHRSTTIIFKYLLQRHRIVQPIYIMTDLSTKEVSEMKRIRTVFDKRFSSLRERFLPTMYFISVDKNNTIPEKYRKLKSTIMLDVNHDYDRIYIAILQCIHGFRHKTFKIEWPFDEEKLIWPIIQQILDEENKQ